MSSDDTGAQYCGFLNILKPPGMSSARVVAILRRRFGGIKVGHAGTLDPEAAGVLPLMIGKATRLFDELQQDEKAYIAEIAFGFSTDTQDAQGTVVETGQAVPTEHMLRTLFPALLGEMMQLPPMYSALKKDGKRLYDLARDGITVERQPRKMALYSLELMRMMPRCGALIKLTCSKGFYVRTLCHDIGQALHCPAHMRFLLRTATGIFTIDTATTLEDVERAADLQALLIPVEEILLHLPHAEVPVSLIKKFTNGVALPMHAFPALQDIPQGGRIQLRMAGKTAAIAVRQGSMLKQSTWLK